MKRHVAPLWCALGTSLTRFTFPLEELLKLKIKAFFYFFNFYIITIIIEELKYYIYTVNI